MSTDLTLFTNEAYREKIQKQFQKKRSLFIQFWPLLCFLFSSEIFLLQMVSPFAENKSKDTAEGGPSQVTGDSLKVDFGKKLVW